MILQMSMLGFSAEIEVTELIADGEIKNVEDTENMAGVTTDSAIKAGEIEYQGLVEPLSEQTNLGNIFTNAVLKVNGEEVSNDVTIGISDGTTVELILDWGIADDVALKVGDFATIQIPKAFTYAVSDKGDLKDGDKVIGTYEIDESGILKVVFNEELINLEERNGQVGLALKFDETVINENNQQRIIFGEPISKDFVITIKPKTEQAAIKKSGAPSTDINPTHINWVVDVNKNFDILTNAKIKDITPAGLELDGNIEIYKLTMGADGKIKTETFCKNSDDFPVELGQINSAYRLKYKTKIVSYGVEYVNNATLYDGEEVKDTSVVKIDRITRGSYVEKTGQANASTNATKIKWTIDINKAQDSLSNVTLSDNLPDGLTIDSKGIKVYELNPSGSNWIQGTEVMKEQISFPLSFENIEGQAYRIIFDTDIDYEKFIDAEGKFIASLDFANEAILYQTIDGEYVEIDSDDAKVTIKRGTLIEKSGKEVTNYGEPLMEWTIYINKANQKIYKAVLEDTVGEGLEIMKTALRSITVRTSLIVHLL